MRLNEKQLPCPKDEFLAKLSAYSAEREAHKSTVGIPAPFPEYEILRTIYENGGAVEIYADPEPEPLPVPPPPEPTPLQMIVALEAQQTPRLIREAALGGEYAKNRLAQIEEQIARLREQI